jgi:hypothetical protein
VLQGGTIPIGTATIAVDEKSRLLSGRAMDSNTAYDDRGFFGSRVREWRHNPCLMQPTSLVMFLLFGIFMLTTLILQAPTLLLGLFLSPILSRSAWYVEFLYPWDIGRWAHFFLMKASSSKKTTKDDDKNRGFHSRTIEQRIEVVPGRVYIHPLPQWLGKATKMGIFFLPPDTATLFIVEVTHALYFP